MRVNTLGGIIFARPEIRYIPLSGPPRIWVFTGFGAIRPCCISRCTRWRLILCRRPNWLVVSIVMLTHLPYDAKTCQYQARRRITYNKLFTKILDSTVWLENDATRLVWITMLAVMDEDGFVALSSVGNVAARARVSLEAANAAIKALEAPDKEDSSQEHEGRRIERVPYGWMVLNARKYRDIVQRAESMRKNRERVAKHREKRNAGVMPSNELVMQSEAYTEAETLKEKKMRSRGSRLPADWQPSEILKAWATRKRPDLDPQETLENFRDYWSAVPGGRGLKLNWDATFRKWVRDQKQGQRTVPDYSSLMVTLKD